LKKHTYFVKSPNLENSTISMKKLLENLQVYIIYIHPKIIYKKYFKFLYQNIIKIKLKCKMSVSKYIKWPIYGWNENK